MRCSQCDTDNPSDNKFCIGCGAKLEAPPPTPTASANVCPQCGSELGPEALFCGNCGAKLARVCPQCGFEPPAGTRFCTKCGHDLTDKTVRQVTRLGSGVKRAVPLPSTIAAAVGGILMLISLAVTWYTLRLPGYQLAGSSADVSAGDLIDAGGVSWAGSALPLILMIIFASAVLLSIFYSVWRGALMRALWVWLGAMSALCVIGNAAYILWWVHDNTNQWVNIVNVGSILAFVGALAVMFSTVGASARVTSPR